MAGRKEDIRAYAVAGTGFAMTPEAQPAGRIFHLVYVSTAARPMDDGALENLLVEARERNRREGITGMLVYCGGNFMQALEGSRQAVERIFASIKRDSRHRNVQMLLTFEDERRDFPDWSMGYSHSPHPIKLEGFRNLLTDGDRIRDELSQDRLIRRVLLEFIERHPV
jgi:hypothetical protein